jgi:hypothetical protein
MLRAACCLLLLLPLQWVLRVSTARKGGPLTTQAENSNL